MVEQKTVGTLITWGLLLLFLALFLVAVFSPGDSLAAKVANLGRAVEAYLPLEPEPNIQDNAALPENVLDGRDTLLSSFGEAVPPEGEHCVLPLAGLDRLEGYAFEMVINPDGSLIRLLQPSGAGYIRYSSKQLEDISFCRVDAEAFYSCFFGPDRTCGEEMYSADPTITFDIGRTADIALQVEDGKFCLIPVSDDSSRCRAEDGGLTTGCIEQMKKQNRFPVCGQRPAADVSEDIRGAATEELDRFASFLNNQAKGSLGETCRISFRFDGSKLTAGSYLILHPAGTATLYHSIDGTGQVIAEASADFVPFIGRNTLYEGLLDEIKRQGEGDLAAPYLISPRGISFDQEQLPQVRGVDYNLVQKEGVWVLTDSGLYASNLGRCGI